MVTRHRVNLSLSDGDYQRLVDQAALEGKTPTTFALDLLKGHLSRNNFALPVQPRLESRTASQDRSVVKDVLIPARKEKPSLKASSSAVEAISIVVPQNRAQRRASAKKKSFKPGRP